MPGSDSRTTETVRKTFDPDPAAVDRIIDFALAPRPVGHRARYWVAAGLGLLAVGATLWRAWPVEEPGGGILFNQGEIYVSRTAAGTRIHNNPPVRPIETGTLQIIWTGDLP